MKSIYMKFGLTSISLAISLFTNLSKHAWSKTSFGRSLSIRSGENDRNQESKPMHLAAIDVKSKDQTLDFEFKVLNKTIVYDGWRKIIRKEVNMPQKKSVMFDVVTTLGMPSITVFIWDTKSATATLIQEYHPGVEKMMYGVVAGGFESHKHSSPMECAASELEEEAHLFTNKFIPLLGHENVSIPFEKYSDNRLYPYLALDCTLVDHPKPLDEEEHITIHRNITYDELMELISNGEMNIISSYTAIMAINKLVEMKIPLRKE